MTDRVPGGSAGPPGADQLARSATLLGRQALHFSIGVYSLAGVRVDRLAAATTLYRLDTVVDHPRAGEMDGVRLECGIRERDGPNLGPVLHRRTIDGLVKLGLDY